MKILLVHNFYRQRGGEEIYLASLKSLLKKRGHAVKIFRKDSKKTNTLWKKIKGVSGLFFNNKTFNELLDTIDSFKPDIVHFNNLYPLISPSVYMACKRRRVRTVQTVHSLRFFFPLRHPGGGLVNILYFASVQLHRLIGSFKLVDAYVFPGKYLLDYHREQISFINKNKFFYVPHFAIERARKVKKEDFFLFAGRLSKDKGILDLLEAVFQTNFKLLVVGDGPLRGYLKNRFRGGNIQFKNMTPHSNIYNYLSRALCTIIPSKVQEAGPMIMIESFACSTPVLVPNLASFKASVKEPRTGVFYSSEDKKDLLKKIRYLFERKKLLKSMAINAREEYENLYTEEKHYQNLLKVYKSGLSE